MVFRLENNVPEVYPEKSRDFQLFCRLYDLAFNSTKFSIDSLQRASSTKECDAVLLELLKTKLGLFTHKEASDDELRQVLQAFPTIIRYKGSERAINLIIALYSRITNTSDFASYDKVALRENHELLIVFTKKLANDTLILEMLKFVLPTGYPVRYKIVPTNVVNENLVLSDTLVIDASTNDYHELQKINPDGTTESGDTGLIGTVGNTTIRDREGE